MQKVEVSEKRTLRPRKILSPEKPKNKAKDAGKVNKKPPGPTRGKKTKLDNPKNDEPAPKVHKSNEEQGEEKIQASSMYDFKATTINGQEISLEKYKGHVCLIVNVASRCGHTSLHYKELVELYDKYNEDKGLCILAFPCNQFGKQEPGDNEKICEFAKKKNVKFDMFEKIDVNGKNAHPLWKFLTSQKDGPKGSKIDWNFTKFLISKDGEVVARYKPSIKPSALVEDLEKLW